jgi:pseudaminic acid synthase
MKHIDLQGKRIGPDEPVYLIAELSANHHQDIATARSLIQEAREAGADAIKLQTYRADSLTIDCDRDEFVIGKGSIWEGRKLFDLYGEAFTPWEWHGELFELANSLGMQCFSTPFDRNAVDFLERLDPPCYKIASFELVDLPLVEYVASKGRPIIMSTGMGSLSEISEAVEVIRNACVPLALLKCTSAYPATPDSMNLRTIPHLAEAFDVPAGLSDHTLGVAVPIAAVALGACIIEKHMTLSREAPGPDSAFSLEPPEFRSMVEAVRTVEKAKGNISYQLTESEQASKVFRRSLFAVADIARGELLTHDNVRSIRPGYGLPPKYLRHLLGHKASRDIPYGTPIRWSDI